MSTNAERPLTIAEPASGEFPGGIHLVRRKPILGHPDALTLSEAEDDRVLEGLAIETFG